MKANELRIGNLVYFDFNGKSDLHIIIPRDIHVMNLCEIGKEESECYKPIPLTKEWLLKFRFELQYGFGGIKRYYKDRYLIENGISMFFDNGFSFRITTDAQNSTHASSVKYVHQLQNLYFALTSKELEIKENL